jgi:replication factor C small subunit
MSELQATVDSTLWVEKYKPKTIDDVLCEKHLKDKFKEFIDKKDMPCLLLAGSAGNGKCVHRDTEIEIFVSDELYEKLK